jgi:hypothetical protein
MFGTSPRCSRVCWWSQAGSEIDDIENSEWNLFSKKRQPCFKTSLTFFYGPTLALRLDANTGSILGIDQRVRGDSIAYLEQSKLRPRRVRPARRHLRRRRPGSESRLKYAGVIGRSERI